MASIIYHSIVLILLVTISLKPSLAVLTKTDTMKLGLGYASDYEMLVKNTNGKVFIAYIIDQGDIVIKKKCRCTRIYKCNTEKMIKLSK